MSEPKPSYVRLDEAGFRELVAGRVVDLRDGSGGVVKLILADIGWTLMLRAVHDARLGKGEKNGERTNTEAEGAG